MNTISKSAGKPGDADHSNRSPKHGEVSEFARQHGMSRPTVRARLRSGDLKVDDAGHIRLPMELRAGRPIDPVIGPMRAAWDRHVERWLSKADSLADHRPSDWVLQRADVLRYLRGRLDALVEQAEREEAESTEAREAAAAARVEALARSGTPTPGQWADTRRAFQQSARDLIVKRPVGMTTETAAKELLTMLDRAADEVEATGETHHDLTAR